MCGISTKVLASNERRYIQAKFAWIGGVRRIGSTAVLVLSCYRLDQVSEALYCTDDTYLHITSTDTEHGH